MWLLTPIQYAAENQECLVGLSSKDKSIWRGCRLGCIDMNMSMDWIHVQYGDTNFF